MIGKFLLVLLLEVVVLLVVVIGAISMGGSWGGALATVGGVAGVAVISASALRMLWNPMLASFEARPPAEDAVRRRFQSFGLGIVNMGFSIHVAVDDEFLHLDPLPVLRWLGARPASIPWSQMQPVGSDGRAVKVDGHTLHGPKWCMELAMPAASADEG